MQKVTVQSQRDRVFHETHKAIVAGELKPGDPISEREYGKRANVSRVPVREALIQLESAGLVTMIPERGAFVRAFGLQDVRQLYEVREGLEGMAARLAAGRMDAGDLSRFVALFRAFLDAGGEVNRDEMHAVNVRFHEAIALSCDNALLQRMLSNIRDQIQIARVRRFSKSSTAEILERARHHLGIAEALLAGDGAEAERRMRAHVAAWRDWEF